MIKSNIGKNLKKFRQSAGLTQQELADRLGLSRPTISSWEVNRTEPSMNDVQKIAGILNCSIIDLLGDYKAAMDLDEYMQNKYLQQFILYAGAHQPKDNEAEFYATLRAMYDALLTVKK